MKIGKTFGGKAFNVVNYLLLALFSFACIYPMLYCLIASFSQPERVDAYNGLLLYPLGFSLKAYVSVFKDPNIISSFLYTIYLVVVGTSINIIMTAFAAYVLSRKKFALKKPIMVMIIITMYFGGGLIPFYIIITQYLHLKNSSMAILLPYALNTFNMFVMRTYFNGISDSLEESAKIDGANDFTILFRIILPVSLPVVAVMIIYYGVSNWNGWFSAMIFLSRNKWIPLQLLLRNVLITNDMRLMADSDTAASAEQVRRLVKYALVTITTVPIVTIYPFVQKYFIGGFMLGSLKE